MNRELDSRMQNILQDTNGIFSNEYIQNVPFIPPEKSSSTNWNFGPSPQQLLQQSTPYLGLQENELTSPYCYPLDFYSRHDNSLRKHGQSSSAAHLGPNRISLIPQKSYHEGILSRTMSNAENNLRFKQHLRQGTSLHESQQRIFGSNPDTVTQLANAMLLRQPLVNPRTSKPNIESFYIKSTQNMRDSPKLSQKYQIPALFKSSKIRNCFSFTSTFLNRLKFF